MINLSYIKNMISDSGTWQILKANFFRRDRELKKFSTYGISFGTPEGAFGVVLSHDGKGNDQLVMVDLPGSRFKDLQPGELKIGNYLTGDNVYFRENGGVEVNSTSYVTVTTPLETVDGNEAVTGDMLVGGGLTVTGDLINHPSVARAWVTFDGTSSSPITPGSSYNIDGTITRNSLGNYTVTWGTPFTSAEYVVLISASFAATPCIAQNITTQTAGSVTFQLTKLNTGIDDFGKVGVVAYGNQ